MRTQHRHGGDHSSPGPSTVNNLLNLQMLSVHHTSRTFMLVCMQFITNYVFTCRPFAVDFAGPNIPRGLELTGNIFDMLGRLNLSSLHSNVQHLATTLSGHSPSLVADALCDQPTHLSYSQHEPRLSVSIGTSRSSGPRALQLHGQAYISRGWAASHLQLNSAQAQNAFPCDDNLPLLDRVRYKSSSPCSAMLPDSGS